MQRTKVNKTGNAWKKMGLKGSVPLGGGEGGGRREEGGGRREEGRDYTTPPFSHPVRGPPIWKRKKLYINPLTPKGDQHLISPCDIKPESHIRVTRIKKMITSQRSP